MRTDTFLLTKSDDGETFHLWVMIEGGLSIETIKKRLFEDYVQLDQNLYEKPVEALIRKINDNRYHNLVAIYDKSDKVVDAYFDGEFVRGFPI